MKYMKSNYKLLSLIAVVMVLMLVSCNNGDTKTETTIKDSATISSQGVVIDTIVKMNGIDTNVVPRPLRPGN